MSSPPLSTPFPAPSLPPSSASPSASALREDVIGQAVAFLRDPRAWEAGEAKAREFLLKKGLSEEEVREAFRRAGPVGPLAGYRGADAMVAGREAQRATERGWGGWLMGMGVLAGLVVLGREFLRRYVVPLYFPVEVARAQERERMRAAESRRLRENAAEKDEGAQQSVNVESLKELTAAVRQLTETLASSSQSVSSVDLMKRLDSLRDELHGLREMSGLDESCDHIHRSVDHFDGRHPNTTQDHSNLSSPQAGKSAGLPNAAIVASSAYPRPKITLQASVSSDRADTYKRIKPDDFSPSDARRNGTRIDPKAVETGVQRDKPHQNNSAARGPWASKDETGSSQATYSLLPEEGYSVGANMSPRPPFMLQSHIALRGADEEREGFSIGKSQEGRGSGGEDLSDAADTTRGSEGKVASGDTGHVAEFASKSELGSDNSGEVAEQLQVNVRSEKDVPLSPSLRELTRDMSATSSTGLALISRDDAKGERDSPGRDLRGLGARQILSEHSPSYRPRKEDPAAFPADGEKSSVVSGAKTGASGGGQLEDDDDAFMNIAPAQVDESWIKQTTYQSEDSTSGQSPEDKFSTLAQDSKIANTRGISPWGDGSWIRRTPQREQETAEFEESPEKDETTPLLQASAAAEARRKFREALIQEAESSLSSSDRYRTLSMRSAPPTETELI